MDPGHHRLNHRMGEQGAFLALHYYSRGAFSKSEGDEDFENRQVCRRCKLAPTILSVRACHRASTGTVTGG
jgi:hypothetical protein